MYGSILRPPVKSTCGGWGQESRESRLSYLRTKRSTYGDRGIESEACQEIQVFDANVGQGGWRCGAKRAGLPLTKDVDRRVERIATVRTHFERGLTLPEIAEEMTLSTRTIAVYLRASFRAEGKSVPRMGRRRKADL